MLKVLKNKKILSAILCIIGLLLVAYGMINKENVLFVAGLPFIIAGYLIIRRELKRSIQRDEQDELP